MKIGFIPAILLVIMFTITFAACDHSLGPMPERQYAYTSIFVREFEKGSVIIEPTTARPGEAVFIDVNPDPGYILVSGGIVNEGIGTMVVVDNHFEMPSVNVMLNIALAPVPAGNYTVTCAPVSHGRITPYRRYGPQGTAITVSVIPEKGYSLKPDSLKANGVTVQGPPYTFLLNRANVTLTAEFEKNSDVQRLLLDGKKALEAGNYDAAARYFESAYNADSSNDEAVFWFSLAKLARLCIQTDVRDTIKRLAFPLPNTLNLLFSESWMTRYYYGDGSYKVLPAVSAPAGWRNDPPHQSTLTGTLDFTFQTLRVDFWYSFIRNNPRGYNELLDNLLDFLFGKEFESAAAIAATMNDTRIPVNQALIEKLYLQDFLEDGETVGRAELDMVFSAFRMGKALLEYLAAYDWASDTNIFPIEPVDRSFNDIVNQAIVLIKQLIAPGTGKDENTLEAFLPIRGNLLTLRNAGMLSSSRQDFAKAINTLNQASGYYFGQDTHIPQSVLDIRDDYRWMPGALQAIQTELGRSGGVFYFSGDFIEAIRDFSHEWFIQGGKFNMPKGNSYTSPSAAKYAVKFDKLFAPSQFALTNMFITAGRTPRFYGFNGNLQNGVEITRNSHVSTYRQMGLKLNMKAFREVIVKGLEQYSEDEWLHTLIPEAIFDREPYQNTSQIFDYYYR